MLFVILGGCKIPEIPFGVLLQPRPTRRWELQMLEQGCEGLTRPIHHPPGGAPWGPPVSPVLLPELTARTVQQGWDPSLGQRCTPDQVQGE